ncbi:MAG: SPOR domain-containing protein [Micavibrio aeruginosavorus]|uniref:SPOR domain-containing protein n=1 Tax=Micavibrio aeruginosavorus TaxID=349221 RepID=A0A7T5R3U4_9BACT|nr:MAG: SPOR domain-containing protein [Micavibrio aeruginosavorus]
MQNHDEFDEPNAAKAIGSIMNALDLRAQFEARKPVFATGIVVALLAVLGSVIWYSYPRESAQREVMNTPIVRADAGDYRTVPSEPGGMAIPYRESTVFNTMRSAEGAGAGEVENLLPQPERPVSRDELFAGLKVEEQVAPGVSAEDNAEAVAAADDNVTKEAAATEAPVTEAAAATTPEVAAVAAKPVAPPAPVTTTADNKAAVEASKTEPAAGVQKIDDKPSSAFAGGFYVQLGSVRAREGAGGEWKKLQKSFAALAPLSLRVEEANLGEKGMFYRIQGGPVTEAEAKAICQSVIAQKPGGCLVVRK